MMPDGWNMYRLDQLGGKDRPAIKAGPFGSSLKKEFYVSKGYKIYGQEQVISGDPYCGNYYINETRYAALKSCAIEPRDVLISLVGTVGRVLVIPEDAEPGIINPRLLRLSLSCYKIAPQFIRYFLESTTTRNKLESWSQGGTMGVLNADILKALPTPVPPLPEQEKIAQILSTWDKAIETVEKLIENSQQKKKALMQQLLTGQKRFPGFDGEWKEVRLKEVAKIVMGSSPSSKSYNDKGIGLPLIQGNADIRKRKSAPRLFTTEITKECDVGDILLSVRAPVGEVSSSIHHACIGRGIASIKAYKPQEHDFLYQWLLWHEPRWASLSQGSTFSAVNGNDIRNMTLLFPTTIEEKKKIASTLSSDD